MGNMVEDDRIQIKKLELGPFGTNAYVLTCLSSNASVVVDAPAEAKKISEELTGTTPKYILITHNHMDHTGALENLKSTLNVPVAAHADDAAKLPVRPDLLLKDGDRLSFGDMHLTVLHTPGHTPGSLSFLIGNYLIAGDTIFPDGPGKTWSPADFKRIVESLTLKIFVLPDETQVFPGHGEATVLKREKRLFEEFTAKPHESDICGDVLWSG